MSKKFFCLITKQIVFYSICRVAVNQLVATGTGDGFYITAISPPHPLDQTHTHTGRFRIFYHWNYKILSQIKGPQFNPDGIVVDESGTTKVEH